MKKLKENKSLQYILGIILLVLIACYLPQEILFWNLCTEQDRELPPNTEVLVSACKRPIATGVPGGEVLFVHEGRTGRTYLLDLRTGEKRWVPNDPLLLDKGIFLSSELVWLEGSSSKPDSPGYRPHYILDLTDGKRYELLDLDLLPRLERGKFDSKNYAYIEAAEKVFIHHSENILIALSSDFRTNLKARVIFSGYAIGTEHGELLEQLMKDLDVKYEIVDLSLHYADVPSPGGRYFIRYDGIYFSKTNILIMDHKLGFIGWYFDESALIYDKAGHCYLPVPGVNCLYYVLGPVLKLNLIE